MSFFQGIRNILPGASSKECPDCKTYKDHLNDLANRLRVIKIEKERLSVEIDLIKKNTLKEAPSPLTSDTSRQPADTDAGYGPEAKSGAEECIRIAQGNMRDQAETIRQLHRMNVSLSNEVAKPSRIDTQIIEHFHTQREELLQNIKESLQALELERHRHEEAQVALTQVDGALANANVEVKCLQSKVAVVETERDSAVKDLTAAKISTAKADKHISALETQLHHEQQAGRDLLAEKGCIEREMEWVLVEKDRAISDKDRYHADKVRVQKQWKQAQSERTDMAEALGKALHANAQLVTDHKRQQELWKCPICNKGREEAFKPTSPSQTISTVQHMLPAIDMEHVIKEVTYEEEDIIDTDVSSAPSPEPLSGSDPANAQSSATNTTALQSPDNATDRDNQTVSVASSPQSPSRTSSKKFTAQKYPCFSAETNTKNDQIADEPCPKDSNPSSPLLVLSTSELPGSEKGPVDCVVVDKDDETVEAALSTTADGLIETKIEAPIEDAIESPVETLVETPSDILADSPTDAPVETSVETTIDDSVETAVEHLVEHVIEVAVEHHTQEAVKEGMSPTDVVISDLPPSSALGSKQDFDQEAIANTTEATDVHSSALCLRPILQLPDLSEVPNAEQSRSSSENSLRLGQLLINVNDLVQAEYGQQTVEFDSSHQLHHTPIMVMENENSSPLSSAAYTSPVEDAEDVTMQLESTPTIYTPEQSSVFNSKDLASNESRSIKFPGLHPFDSTPATSCAESERTEPVGDSSFSLHDGSETPSLISGRKMLSPKSKLKAILATKKTVSSSPPPIRSIESIIGPLGGTLAGIEAIVKSCGSVDSPVPGANPILDHEMSDTEQEEHQMLSPQALQTISNPNIPRCEDTNMSGNETDESSPEAVLLPLVSTNDSSEEITMSDHEGVSTEPEEASQASLSPQPLAISDSCLVPDHWGSPTPNDEIASASKRVSLSNFTAADAPYTPPADTTSDLEKPEDPQTEISNNLTKSFSVDEANPTASDFGSAAEGDRFIESPETPSYPDESRSKSPFSSTITSLSPISSLAYNSTPAYTHVGPDGNGGFMVMKTSQTEAHSPSLGPAALGQPGIPASLPQTDCNPTESGEAPLYNPPNPFTSTQGISQISTPSSPTTPYDNTTLSGAGPTPAKGSSIPRFMSPTSPYYEPSAVASPTPPGPRPTLPSHMSPSSPMYTPIPAASTSFGSSSVSTLPSVDQAPAVPIVTEPQPPTDSDKNGPQCVSSEKKVASEERVPTEEEEESEEE